MYSIRSPRLIPGWSCILACLAAATCSVAADVRRRIILFLFPSHATPCPVAADVRRRTILLLLPALAAASCAAVAQPAAAPVFNVRSYGATGDGKTLDSPSINQAIIACEQSGGGTVWFPAGAYLSGSIHLSNNIHLYLDAGATVLGAPTNMNAYDPAEPFPGHAYQDGGHTYFHNSLIWGENLTNVSITGQGWINGGGVTRRDKNPDLGPISTGDKAIALKLCRNVLLRDITIAHGGHFAVLVTGCDNMTLDNLTIDTDRDGIDIDCCRNTTVSNCRINSPNDDALCPKSSFALGENRATENLSIVNCQVSGFVEGTLLDGTMVRGNRRNGRIKLGTEANGGFRNVTIANCVCRNCKGLALEEVDGGIMDNIAIDNITMMDVSQYPIYITLGSRNRGPNVTNNSIGRHIRISHVVADGVERMSGIQITGTPEQPLEDVRLDDIRLNFHGGGTLENAALEPKELGTIYPEPSRLGTMPAYGVFARHVRGLELANIQLTFDTNDFRPPIICTNVDGLIIDNFKAQTVTNAPPSRFDQVTGLTIRNSPGLQ